MEFQQDERQTVDEATHSIYICSAHWFNQEIGSHPPSCCSIFVLGHPPKHASDLLSWKHLFNNFFSSGVGGVGLPSRFFLCYLKRISEGPGPLCKWKSFINDVSLTAARQIVAAVNRPHHPPLLRPGDRLCKLRFHISRLITAQINNKL